MGEGERIGGYRLLRRLAVGSRATIRLAHGGEPAATVVLKATPADDPGACREAAALDRGAGAHVVALLDVAADDDRLTLVLPRLPGGDLARLLAQRTTLEGGEAVTILAPIAATVVRLHDAGVAHGALRAGSVLFDDDGAPVLTGFGSAAMFAPGAPEVERERVPEVAADRAALRAIASTVLDRVAGGRSAAAQRLRSEAAAASDADVAALLATRVFEVAAARPVRDADPVAAEAGGGLRIIPLAEPVAVADGEPDRNRMRRQGWAARVESWLDRSPVADAKAALVLRWTAMSRGRRRLALAVTAGAAALVVALAVIPGPSGAATAPASASPQGAARSTSTPTSAGAPSTAVRSTPSTPGGSEEATLRGDDPAAAATVLLRRREACRRELSVLCLDGVDQDGSAAADLDRAALRSAQDGGELVADLVPAATDASPRLGERLGDSALVTLTGGASMLLVREGDGWRIRDLLGAPSSAGRTPSTPPPAG